VVPFGHRQTLLSALDAMQERFAALDARQTTILTHADLSLSNMVVSAAGDVTPIDFGLSGYSHYQMDIGGLFSHIQKAEDRQMLLRGYESAHGFACDMRSVEPYFALQVLLFIATQYERAVEWEWFSDALVRWCGDIFTPLADGKPFLLLS